MLGEGGTPLEKLEREVDVFLRRGKRGVDLKAYRAVIDALEGDFAAVAHAAQQSGEHLVAGSATAVAWIARSCGMSATSVADRLCVGEQLESLPGVAAALSSGEISYQSASLLCHLRDQLGDKRELFDQAEMLELARKHSVATLRYLCRYARHVADPDGFAAEAEENFSRRRLHISQMADGLHLIDGILDPVGGAALKTAIDSLARRLGADDERTPAQRRADSLVELAQHAMDEGRLPRRNGVKPHVTVTATLEGLKNELGAPPAEVEQTLPVRPLGSPRVAREGSLRLHDLARAARGLGGDRRRTGGARRLGAGAAGAAGERQGLPVAWLRPSVLLGSPRRGCAGRIASHRVLGSRRSDQAKQPGPALLLPPPTRP